ncbi:sigma-70 family RNA polymerase sigma factor [Flagellimonas allohymeniacidonis]|uniref:Sigma-70 family RNA polymerase sigma factor n=1 Tax=Flagellimonas allohymeniacidonis TaxID=2517819 RepID=A0A4Q8QH93_9FLAO|nr:sigma-70 family RNA polymerase sigma factor [Allomuricauda hymeniacidonis]TAI49137.1 sigma-70 family RNA polymerase sigma factor [Allomuricauda hymeniacidonis]
MKNYHDILFPYAYNILGSSEDAKDIIQDILIKYLSINKDHIENEIGYLAKSVINQSINVKKKKKTISADSIWLPEPISTENADVNINKEEILSYSILVLLEKLSAKERAVFILKESFDYSHKEIAETIGFTIENSRKLLSRAKSKLNTTRNSSNTNYQQDTSQLRYYVEAMKSGDITSLEKLLSKDILLAADGGEHVKVVRAITNGIRDVSKLSLYVFKAFLTGLEIRISTVNHQPAILYYQNGALYNCQVFEMEKTKIRSIYSIVDPKKLKSLFP